MVSSRAAIHPHGPGNGAAPLVRQGAHRARRGARTQPPGPGEGKRVTRRSTRPRSGRLPLPKSGAPLGSVTDPRPQERVQRHIVAHLADLAPMVQIVDVPVPQKGNELADFLKLVDKQTPVEQVVAVPKISNDSIQPRLVLRRSQMAEQLAEVPTEPGYATTTTTIIQSGEAPF